MLLHLIRTVFLLAMLALALSFAYADSDKGANEGITWTLTFLVFPPLIALGIVLVDMFWREKRLELLSGLLLGALGGLLLAWVVGSILGNLLKLYPNLKDDSAVQLGVALLQTICVFLSITIVMQTKDDFRFIIPYVEFSKQTKGASPLLLDTSVIIDGRIADIVETDVFDTPLIVPRFVLAELQTVADSKDKLKRNRGRHGLDVLQRLQNSDSAEVDILDVHIAAVESARDVDAKLVALAQHLNGRVITNDFNLNKVASLRGVAVVNLNDLANAIKPIVLPGEGLRVKIIRPGEDSSQGVGYLDDGTMIVAEGGRKYVGTEIDLVVTSVLQTSAGRMIFGKVADS